jgi:uncharacterized membrane protein
MDDSVQPETIPRARFAWLEEQSDRWVRRGLVDEATRGRIVAEYEPQSSQGRGTLVIVVLAALMVGIGVLLLIGYNWARLGPATKVAMMMTLVAALFAGAAFEYARRHALAGETLALIGTLAFANSIWLIAQVLHIQGHFPDGFLWSAVGALAVAFALGSRWIGIAAAIFALGWLGAAGIQPPHGAPVAFLLFGPAAIALVYHLRSSVMLRIAAFACALWVFVLDPERLPEVLFLSAVPLTGCALYAVGAWHQKDVGMRRAWQGTGLLVLLVTFLVLLNANVHLEVRGGAWWTSAAAVLSIATLVTGTLVLRRGRDAADIAVTAVAAFLVVWAVLLVAGISQPPHLWVTLFSVLALVMSVSLIRTALRTDDPSSLAFGTLFGLGFLLVRWTNVVENMLWSGLLLLVAGGGLLLVARLWRTRERQLAESGRMS